MLKRLSPREQFEQLVSNYEPLLRLAFIEAIDDIRSNIVFRRVVERLERGEAALRPLDEAIRQAFNGGGVAMVEKMPALRDPEGHRFVIRFDARNVEAENWLRYHSTTLVSNIIADQQEGIRMALQSGLERGDNPTRTALDVVGRVNRVTARREGGLIGLTAVQGNAVARARQELISGQPDQLRSYLTRGRRDTRFDRTVLAAIGSGKSLLPETVNRIVGRHSDSLLKLRGETIARSRTRRSVVVAIRPLPKRSKTTLPRSCLQRLSAGNGRSRCSRQPTEEGRGLLRTA